MRKVLRIFLVSALCLALSGCLGTNVRSGAIPASEPELRMNVTLLWGLKESNIHAKECGDGLANVRTVWPIWGGVVAWLTFLLVVPTYTVYECAGA